MSTYIHPTAVIDPGASVGEGSRVWHFCHLHSGARVGRGCTLGQNVYLGEGVRIGNGVKLQNGVSVFAGVTLEDDVFCGPGATFTNCLRPRAAFPQDAPARTLVCHGATIGANATVVCGSVIGPWAMVGAGSVVTHDVPAHALVYGVPAVQHGWACVCGQVLLPTLVCPQCGRRYRPGTHGLASADGD